MALARTLEMLKRAEQVEEQLYRSTTSATSTRGDRARRPRLERAPGVWERLVLASIVAHRPSTP